MKSKISLLLLILMLITFTSINISAATTKCYDAFFGGGWKNLPAPNGGTFKKYDQYLVQSKVATVEKFMFEQSFSLKTNKYYQSYIEVTQYKKKYIFFGPNIKNTFKIYGNKTKNNGISSAKYYQVNGTWPYAKHCYIIY